MAKRVVVWTKTADLQYIGILEYWVNLNQSSAYSRKLVKLVSDRTRLIAKNPFLFKASSFKDIRVASMGNYCIYYKVIDVQIVITSFWDNRQDPKKLLEILKGER